MKKTIFMEKYPICTIEIKKNKTTYTTIVEVVEHLKSLVDNHKIAAYIATFDNYSHTTKLNGAINPNIKDAQYLIFCFGSAIPNTQILAVRPRSIGIAELDDSFMIEFLEAPKEELTILMQTWANSIVNK
jgi:hypothetical protein